MCSDVRKDKDAATLERLVPWALAGRTAWSHRMPQSAPKKLRQHHPAPLPPCRNVISARRAGGV